jgi:tRNA (cmo5U34)-methyltransferase
LIKNQKKFTDLQVDVIKIIVYIIKIVNKLKVDKNIYLENGPWTFEKNIAAKFDSHIKKSVPMYEESQWLCNEISDFFIKENCIIYDLGCSTGTYLKSLALRHKSKKQVTFYGVDVVKQMINFAKKKNYSKNIKYLHKDITKLKMKKSDFIISFFTMQFLKQKYRQIMINKIYKSLNWGGAFFFAEKVRSYDARTQDMMNEIYKEWKLANRFTDEEINAKTKSLKGVLDPFSTAGNLKMLKKSGFSDISSIAKFISFEVFLAIK